MIGRWSRLRRAAAMGITQALGSRGDSTSPAGSKTAYYPEEIVQFTEKVIWVAGKERDLLI